MQRFGLHSARHTRILVGAILLLTLGGCATNFHGAYRFSGTEQALPAVASQTQPTPPTTPPGGWLHRPEVTESPASSARLSESTEFRRASPAPAPNEVGSWTTWLIERLQQWFPGVASPSAIMGELTATTAIVLIDGLGLSPTVRIISTAAVVILRPLLREFFEWLGKTDDIGLAPAPPPELTPVASSESKATLPGLTRVDESVPPVNSPPEQRVCGRIGCCDVN